jgi:hypothetical protein
MQSTRVTTGDAWPGRENWVYGRAAAPVTGAPPHGTE